MAALLPPGILQFCDAVGAPYAAGKLDTFVVSTTTPKTTWKDSGKVAANTNPIELDSAGRCVMFGDGAYRLRLKDADGNEIWDKPSSTLVSEAMAPVVLAPTIADALVQLGVQAAIDAAVTAEATARAAADTTNATAIAAEAATRATAVTNIQTALATEATNRIAADAAEATARAAGDAALQAQIDAGPAGMPGTVEQTGSSASDGAGDFSVTLPFPYADNILSFTVTSASLRLTTASLLPDGPPVTVVTGQLWQDVGLADPGALALSTAFNWVALGW